jgi:N-acetylneuraminic acid mutarotase
LKFHSPLSITDTDPIILIQTTGEKITERYGHTAALDVERNRMFIFGGCSTNVNQFLEDVYFFSFLHKTWTCVPSPLQILEKEKKEIQGEELANEIAKAAKIWPRGRHFHSAVTYNEKMYIFGGKSNGYMSDIWCFDFGNFFFLFLKSQISIQTMHYLYL